MLAEALAVHCQQGVMGAVGHAAHRVGGQDDSIAEIDRIEHCGEHTDIGFRPGDD